MYRLGDEEDAEDRVFLAGFDRIEARSQERANTQLRKKRLAYGMAAAGALLAVVIIVGLSVGLARKSGMPYTCKDERGASYDTTFFVIGDWGRQGSWDQRQVARMMADVAQCMPPSFVISTGDNFYDHGLKSPNDEMFAKSFSKVYDQGSLQVNWYAVLGNHDYGDKIDPAEDSCAANTLDACPKGCCYSSVWQFTGRPNDVRWHCQNGTWNVPTGNAGLLDIVMIDTNPFMPHYLNEAWSKNAGGIWQQNASQIKQQLRQRLAASKARWKLVVGHHPIASYGHHCKFSMDGDCDHMAWLEADLQDARVAAYLCGHDHDLQYITRQSDPAVQDSAPVWPAFVVSGAGSSVRNNEFGKVNRKEGYNMPFMADNQGFVAARVNASHLVMHYYTASHAAPVYTAVLAAQR